MALNIKEDFLTVNEFSRPGKKLNAVKGVVVHWTGNPGTTAQANRNYFESLDSLKTTYASAHYIIGLDGEVIQCIPDDEMAYHVGAKKYSELALTQLSTYPNNCTIGIELCHPDKSGQFNRCTISACLELVVYLLNKYELGSASVYRHFDITGKDCPRYFVEHSKDWRVFLSDVFKEIARCRTEHE